MPLIKIFLILVLMLSLINCGKQSNVKSDQTTEQESTTLLTIKTKKRPPKGKGKVFLYNLTAEQIAFRYVEQQEATDEAEALEEWQKVDPEKEKCLATEDPCSCAGIHKAQTVFIFWPGDFLKIEWKSYKGAGGYYHQGSIEDGPDGWQYTGQPFTEEHYCEDIELEWDQFKRLLKLSMRCNWMSEDEMCKGEDNIEIAFPSISETRNPKAETLPWNEEVPGSVYRFKDNTADVPESATEASETEQPEILKDEVTP